MGSDMAQQMRFIFTTMGIRQPQPAAHHCTSGAVRICYATRVRFERPNHHFRGEGGAGCWRKSLALLALLWQP